MQKADGNASNAGKRPGFFTRLRQRLNRGNSWLTYDLANLIPGGKIDDELIEELESRLLMADVGVEATEEIINGLNKELARKDLAKPEVVVEALSGAMAAILSPVAKPLTVPDSPRPFVILMVGVNGAGKTTTIGKLAKRLQQQGLQVMLAAGDTFRAAAIEQLQTWGERNRVPVIAQQTGADPAAVIYDALQAAKAREIDVLIADTAGRLQSQVNLMEELKKIKRVIQKLDPSAPHEIMLVLDAGIGQNAIAQTSQFHEAVTLTGLTITKLDGTAKGGILLALAKKFGIPIRFIGIGEQAEDLGPFEAQPFVDALLSPGSQG